MTPTTPQPEPVRPTMRTPETDDFPTGPDIGERVPDFTLLDQDEREVSLGDLLQRDRTLLVFIRATAW